MPFQEVELEENFFVSLISEADDSTGGWRVNQVAKLQKNGKKKKRGSRNAQPKIRKELQQLAVK